MAEYEGFRHELRSYATVANPLDISDSGAEHVNGEVVYPQHSNIRSIPVRRRSRNARIKDHPERPQGHTRKRIAVAVSNLHLYKAPSLLPLEYPLSIKMVEESDALSLDDKLTYHSARGAEREKFDAVVTPEMALVVKIVRLLVSMLACASSTG